MSDVRRRRRRRRRRSPGSRRRRRWPKRARACSSLEARAAARRPRDRVRRSRDRRARRQRPARAVRLLPRDVRVPASGSARAATSRVQPIARQSRTSIARGGGRCCAVPPLPSPLHLLAAVLGWDALPLARSPVASCGWRGRSLQRAGASWHARVSVLAADATRPCRRGCAARPGRAALRDVAVGAARGRGAEPVARRSRGARRSCACWREMFGPDRVGCGDRAADPAAARDVRGAGARVHRSARRRSAHRTRWRGSSDRRRRASPASRCAASAIARRARSIAAVPWFALDTLLVGDTAPMAATIVAAASRMDVEADRDGEPLVRPAGHGRRVRRAAGPRDAVGVRQAAGVRRGGVAPVARGERRRRAGRRATATTLVALRRARGRRGDSRRARRATLLRGTVDPREAGDVLARARSAAAARRRRRRCAASFSPATGSTPGLPGTIESAVVSGHRRGAIAARDRHATSAVGNPCDRQSAISNRAMKSVIVHYQEIALKGKNRPWFVARLVRNIREATNGSRRAARCARCMGRIELVLGPTASTGRRSATAWRTSSASATSRAPAARRSTSTRSPRRSSNDLGPENPRVVPRVGAARRQALSADVAADRARGRRPHQGSARLARRSRRSGADDPRRGADERGVLLLRQGARRRRPAGRRERQVGVPAVGRDRFAGRGVAHDAPRLPRASSSTFTAIRSCRARRRRRRASWRSSLTRFQYRSRLFLVPFGEIQQRVVLAVPPPLRVVDLPPADDADRRARSRGRTARRRSSPARSSGRWRRRRSRTWRRSARS